MPLLVAPPEGAAVGKAARPITHIESGSHVLAGFDASGLPTNFVQRLIVDSQGSADYSRIGSIAEVRTRPANSSYCGVFCACLCCRDGTLVQDGQLGMLRDNEEYEFMGAGYHTVPQCGSEIGATVNVNVVDQAVTYGTLGFVTVSEAKVGLLMVGAEYKLLAPGTYQWQSPRVQFLKVATVTEQIVSLGPYTLVTVPRGQVAVTFNNGDLSVLGDEGLVPDMAADHNGGREAPRRTYFLENAKWRLDGFLPMVMQTDRLEGNDLLSKDNVEVLMVAMSQWRIVDPIRVVENCASRMEEVRMKVNQMVRATIARIVAGTSIGAGPVSGAAARPVVTAAVVADGHPSKAAAADDADLAHLMKSEMASQHMAELKVQMDVMGIEVCGVFVPEKRMKNDDIRREVAKQAVIGIQAEAERAAADAKAYSTVKAARAEAEAIELLANAHSEAGARLGAPETTAARLALSETMSKAMQDAQLTVFSGAPESMPFMFGAPPQASTGARRAVQGL